MKYKIHARSDEGELLLEGHSYQPILDNQIVKNPNSNEILILTRENDNILIEKYEKGALTDKYIASKEIKNDSRNYETLDKLLKGAGL